ncbi:MAG: type I methionyl aminopeptidase [Solirubrobacteraceae bacterium]|nr:type I methionyl aminopeptidase [Solirubrobacteraceae bacterium]
MIVTKSPTELDAMAASGALLVRVHELLTSMVRPGITGKELDRAAEELIRSEGAVPSFKGYQGFPATLCISPNDMVVHGIPNKMPFQDGDLVSIDCGVTLDGWVADAAITHEIGTVTAEAHHLAEKTLESLLAAVEQCVPGNRVGDIGAAVQGVVEGAGLSVVRSLVGHGVGRSMHEDPQVPNYGKPGRGAKLTPGMVIAVEPMVTIGSPEVVVGDDDWAISSVDGSLAAHQEFTIAVTEDGPRVLTPWHPAVK